MLYLRKRRNQNAKVASGSNAGYGMRSRNSPEDMDKAQTLPNEKPLAVDAVYFNGGNKDGQYLVAATARRQNNIVQTILYLRIPEIGFLEIPSLPDTRLRGTEKNAFAAGGLKFDVVEPMKKWKLSYNGKMRNRTTDKLVDVTFDLEWIAFTKYFDFDTDLHPNAMADAIAREKWSRKYFDVLKSVHQTHYEQFGEISGTVNISGEEKFIKIDGVRDHSYGNIRDWKYFHRYALQYCTLEDRTAICVGTICMPITMSRLLVGYVLHPDGDKTYNMKITVLEAPIFYIGEGRDAKIHERFSTYDVNGQTGWGISEWDYRNKES
ncbi:unnamed protein product [Mytilus edulis]|uniref:Uncharacterized protein n=1 Tax=Mytilus edulis TaxID=6550 RepID=A0A8S3TWW0_MYTED|nr:unnamed protein product [Mytilus edulis]